MKLTRSTTSPTVSDWLSPAAAGALLGVGPDRVAQLARDGSLTTMRTPGGHLRVDRGDVERLAANAAAPPEQPADEEPADDAPPEPDAPAPHAAHRQSWEAMPPWRRRVREAQADVEVLGLDDKKDRLQEARAERQVARERAAADRQLQASEEARLRQLKTQALAWYVTYDVPADVRAQVAHEIEQTITSARYPRSLSNANAYALLKAEVDRCLAPWRERQAAAARAAREPKLRELTILTAVVYAMQQMPADWDTSMRSAFERECRRAVADEYQPGMDQTDANAVAQDVLDQWLDEDDDESEDGDDVDDEMDDDEFADDDGGDEEDDDDDNDGDDW